MDEGGHAEKKHTHTRHDFGWVLINTLAISITMVTKGDEDDEYTWAIRDGDEKTESAIRQQVTGSMPVGSGNCRPAR